MKICPKCRRGAISVQLIMNAKPLGEFSLAGAQMKFAAEQRAVATCSFCDLNVLGRLIDPVYDPDINSFTSGHFEEIR